jgi:photosystem II stability/assembly factor-like uncharacterized protein
LVALVAVAWTLPASLSPAPARAAALAQVSEFQPHIQFGGRTVAVDISTFLNGFGKNDEIAAADSGGLFRSRDGGTSWHHLDGLPIFRMTDVRYSPRRANLVVATAPSDTRTASGGGIWVSTDAGSTWTQRTDAFTCGRRTAWGIAFAPDAPTIYVGTHCGLAVSTDDGTTWKNVVPKRAADPAPGNPGVYSVVAQSANLVDACGNGALWRSSDAGTTWSLTTTAAGGCQHGSYAGNGRPHALAVSPFERGALFVAFDGKTVKEVDVPTGTINTHTVGTDDTEREPFVRTRAFGFAFNLYFGGVNVWRQGCSNTAGAPKRCRGSFTSLPDEHDDMMDLAFPPGSSCPKYLASDAGLQRTSDCGANWSRTVAGALGYNALQVYDVGGQLHDGDFHTDMYFGTQDNSLWGSGDSGASWTAGACCEGGAFQLLGSTPTHTGQIVSYYSCNGPCVTYAANAHFANATPWQHPVAGAAGAAILAHRTYIELGTRDTGSLYVTRNYPVPPSTTAPTWTELTGVGIPGTYVGRLLVSPVPPASDPVVYIPRIRSTPACDPGSDSDGCRFGLVRVSGIMSATPTSPATVRSADGDPDTPARLVNLAQGCLGDFVCGNEVPVAVDPSNPNHLIAADAGDDTTPGRMMQTFDGGATWAAVPQLTSRVTDDGRFLFNERYTPFGAPRRGSQVHSIFFNPVNPRKIYVGTEAAGVIVSLDGGVTWTTVEGSQRIPSIGSFFSDLYHGRIVLSSYGRGLWALPIAGGFVFTLRGVPAGRTVAMVDETTGARITLRHDSDGAYRGLEFADFNALSKITYHYEVNGDPTVPFSRTLTSSDLSSGVAPVGDTLVARTTAVSALPSVVYPSGGNLAWSFTYTDSFGFQRAVSPQLSFRSKTGQVLGTMTYDLGGDRVCFSDPSTPVTCKAHSTGGILGNAGVQVDAGRTSTSASGTDRFVTWVFTLWDAAASKLYDVTASAVDGSGASMPWQSFVRQVGVTHAPFTGTLSPNGGTVAPGTAMSLQGTFFDSDSAAEISFARVRFGSTVELQYTRSTNTFRVLDVARGVVTAACTAGAPFKVENTLARIDCGMSRVSISGTQMTVVWGVTFLAPMSPRSYPESLYVSDVVGGSSGDRATGASLTVDFAPEVGGLNPASGGQAPGTTQAFGVRYTDKDGLADLNVLLLQFRPQTAGFPSVELYYGQTDNVLFLGKNNNEFSATCHPGDATPVSNSQARLNCRDTRFVPVADPSGKLIGYDATWSLTPGSAMSSATYLSVLVDTDDLGTLTALGAGTWTVNQPPASGVNDPATGRSAAGDPQVFVTACSDPDGWRNIATIDFVLGRTRADGVVVRAQYDQNRNVVRLYDPQAKRWLEGVPGSAGTLSTRRADLRLAGTSVKGSGPTGPSVRITWDLVLNDARGRLHQYLRITDDTGASTGLDKVGDWKVLGEA